MKIKNTNSLTACLLVHGLSLAVPCHAATRETAESVATLPLARVLAMQAQIDDASKAEAPRPPVMATVGLLALTGRILEQGVEFEARYEVEVLSDEDWVKLSLLGVDERTQLLALPALKKGTLAVLDGDLVFMARRRGHYQFTVSLLQESREEADVSSVHLRLPEASVATCEVSMDEGMFELLNTRTLKRPTGVLVFPEGRDLTISWSTREAAPVREVGPKPEIASVVPRAHASSVSTLEGRRITRILYALRFAGRKEIAFTLPAGQVVERVYLNGFAVPVTVSEGRLRVEASPARAGDESATVELVMRSDEGVFHLAGVVTASLPKVSWPVNEITLSLHLPEVFTYRWTGGSLSPVAAPAMPTYSYEVPLPGKQMVFHQHLVAARAPHVSLDFAVDLKGQYYCAQR